jgi:hypothetical protein
MIRFIGIAVLAVAVGVFAQGARAQEAEEEFSNPGITPDSPWYFLDDVLERAQLTFTFNEEAKARLELSFADERIAEVRAMIEEKKEDAAEKATTRYEAILERVEGKELSPEVLARITEATGKHEAVLERVLANAPEDAKEKLAEVIERAKERHEARFEALLEGDEAEAGRVAGAVLETRLHELKEAVESGELTEDQASELAEKLQEREEFFAAKEQGRIEFRNEFAARLSDAYGDILELEDEDEDNEVDDDVARTVSRLRVRYEVRLEQLAASDPVLGAEAVANATERLRIRIEERVESESNDAGLLNAADRLETVRERIKVRIEQKIEDEVEDEVEDEQENEGEDELGGALERLERATQNRIETLEQVREQSDSNTTRVRIEQNIKQEEKEREELKRTIEVRKEQQKEEEEKRKEERKEREERNDEDKEDNSGSGGGDDE